MFTPEFEANPHPIYAVLRDKDAVHAIGLPSGKHAWLVTRYADARKALADPRLSTDVRRFGHLDAFALVPADLRRAMTSHMLNADPPHHARLRRLVADVFTPRRIEAMRPLVERLAADLLEGIDPDRADLVRDFAAPLPAGVLCELLGIPAADQDRFREWSTVIVAGRLAADRFPAAATAMYHYLRQLLAAKRRQPADDLLSELVAARVENDRLSEDELSSMVFLFLVAGQETAANLIGTALYLFLRHPDQLALLRQRPELLPEAIEEVLRYESPVEMATHRFVAADLELGGQAIPAGDVVLVALNSANRDGDRFDDADRLDLARRDNPHLAFGHGVHFCLGAQLARLEARVALAAALDRFAELRLAVADAELVWRPGVLRGLVALPVRLCPRDLVD
ncbi:cytochrome P450 family protein [Longimycelium tulufanense]|uniref:cytochrome P450 family protein n=1 Tax=Longimycelium tulufanense TaxID=907463 RepID=UPI001E3B840B|nr:cytochrome P450 [Longimycelium tulufanense]